MYAHIAKVYLLICAYVCIQHPHRLKSGKAAFTEHACNMYLCGLVRVQGVLGWESGRGISSEGRWLLQTIWAVKVEALGLDLDLEVISNTWTIFWEGEKGMKEQRGGGWKGFLSKLRKCWHHTFWSGYHGKHTERQFVFTPIKHSYQLICY